VRGQLIPRLTEPTEILLCRFLLPETDSDHDLTARRAPSPQGTQRFPMPPKNVRRTNARDQVDRATSVTLWSNEADERASRAYVARLIERMANR